MYVLLDDQVSHRQLFFDNPVQVITWRPGEDPDAVFAAIDAALAAGHWIAGQMNYEFGLTLEPALRARLSGSDVALRLGVFTAPSDHPPVDMLYRATPPPVTLSPDWSEADYLSRFETVQALLRAGDAYQVNLTFPMRGTCDGDARALYAGYRRRQPGRYGAIVSLGGPDIVSFSPELFFQRTGQDMRMRPMKGTRPRNASPAAMREEPKSQAENLMIVDLLRNDLSRLCEAGTVRVPELFALEEYPTLYQMTSEVTGTLRQAVGWGDIFRALFPCGSVTGAPKIRAMEIIDDLEAMPRGPYCGAVGYIAPNENAAFSVAIRTAVLEGRDIRYDVGSGVVLDSDGADEYRECLLKAELLSAPPETVIETMRMEPPNRIPLADRHRARLQAAMPQADFNAAVSGLTSDAPARIRLVGGQAGGLSAELTPIPALLQPVKLAISRYPLTAEVQRTNVKTSRRDFYEGERARVRALTGADEVLFLTLDGALAEGSFTSIFVLIGEDMFTPPLNGILPGVFRAQMIAEGRAVERVIAPEDLARADAIFVGNALRGLLPATLIDHAWH